MSTLWFYSDPIDRMHQENLQFLLAQRYRQPRSPRDYRFTEREAVQAIIEQAEDRGYRVNRTRGNAPFDLWIEGAKAEVKGATWHESLKGGRYQAAIRNHAADVLLFDCINGSHHIFVIPMAAIVPKTSIAIWHYDPACYVGKWTPYLDAWDCLDEAVRYANHVWQPPLFNLD